MHKYRTLYKTARIIDFISCITALICALAVIVLESISLYVLMDIRLPAIILWFICLGSIIISGIITWYEDELWRKACDESWEEEKRHF